MNPYSVYARTVTENAYVAQAEKLQIYTQETMLKRLFSLTESSLAHSLYPQSYPVADNLNKLRNSQSISMVMGTDNLTCHESDCINDYRLSGPSGRQYHIKMSKASASILLAEER